MAALQLAQNMQNSYRKHISGRWERRLITALLRRDFGLMHLQLYRHYIAYVVSE